MNATTAVLTDLRAEGDELDRLIAGLEPAQWALETPATGWTVAHQIAHLAWTDRMAIMAATDQDAFAAEVRRVRADMTDVVDKAAAEGTRQAPRTLYQRWRQGRQALLDILAAVPTGTRLPWLGPSQSAAGSAAGRLMETWAHGLDVRGALGAGWEPTMRLRHVARLGVRARDFAYDSRGLTPPADEFLVELAAPGGSVWTFGPGDAAQRVTGSGVDFCLLVTRRAHRSGLDLQAEGPDADLWLDIAQAYVGPPGEGREPGARP